MNPEVRGHCYEFALDVVLYESWVKKNYDMLAGWQICISAVNGISQWYNYYCEWYKLQRTDEALHMHE